MSITARPCGLTEWHTGQEQISAFERHSIPKSFTHDDVNRAKVKKSRVLVEMLLEVVKLLSNLRSVQLAYLLSFLWFNLHLSAKFFNSGIDPLLQFLVLTNRTCLPPCPYWPCSLLQ